MMNEDLKQKMQFTPRQIDAAYINSLVELVNACRKWSVKIDKVFAFQNGWQVTFEGFKGYAVCHDHSYGSPCYGGCLDDSVHTNEWDRFGSWETIGFSWDGIDESVHEAEWLARSIARLRNGEEYDESWERYEDEKEVKG